MGDRADLPQAHRTVGVEIGLAARHAAAGHFQHAQPERGDRARIGRAAQIVALHAADRAIEIEAEIGAIIERIAGVFARQQALRLGNPGQRGKRQIVIAEKQITVAALKADLGFKDHAGAGKAAARPAAERPRQSVDHAGGMRAAAHAFAVGVEDQCGDIGHVVRAHGLCQPPLQPFDRQRRGDLTQKAPGIGKPGLDGHASARSRIIAIGGFRQQGIEKAPPVFERGFGFEQGRDIDFVFDAEQPREIQRSQHGLRLFAFGDQHADRRIGIDMVQDLRHDQKLPHGGRGFDCQRAEIHPQRRGAGQHFAQPRQRAPAAPVERAIGIDAAAQGIVQLR